MFDPGRFWTTTSPRRLRRQHATRRAQLLFPAHDLADAVSSPRTSAAIVAIKPTPSLTASFDSALSSSSGKTPRRAFPTSAPPKTTTKVIMLRAKELIFYWPPKAALVTTTSRLFGLSGRATRSAECSGASDTSQLLKAMHSQVHLWILLSVLNGRRCPARWSGAAGVGARRGSRRHAQRSKRTRPSVSLRPTQNQADAGKAEGNKTRPALP